MPECIVLCRESEPPSVKPDQSHADTAKAKIAVRANLEAPSTLARPRPCRWRPLTRMATAHHAPRDQGLRLRAPQTTPNERGRRPVGVAAPARRRARPGARSP